MKKVLNSLLMKIAIAIVLGILVGLVAPDWLSRGAATFSKLFGNFLSFIIPLIIIGLITPAISEFGRGAGKWLGVTAALAYCSTLVAGTYAIAAGYPDDIGDILGDSLRGGDGRHDFDGESLPDAFQWLRFI